jgi:hypothetical protein
MSIQMHGADMRAAADGCLPEQRREGGEYAAQHFVDALCQRFAMLLQQ